MPCYSGYSPLEGSLKESLSCFLAVVLVSAELVEIGISFDSCDCIWLLCLRLLLQSPATVKMVMPCISARIVSMVTIAEWSGMMFSAVGF